MLTALSGEVDRMAGLELGADGQDGPAASWRRLGRN